MNGFTENQTGASGKPGYNYGMLTWIAARRMLPLVEKIVKDVLESQHHLARMHAEKGPLDRQRRSLGWAERSRRYHLQEEIASTEQRLESALTELETLGVVMIDADRGRVGFPTLINKRQAFFSWSPGEEGLQYWHYADDEVRQLVPAQWMKTSESLKAGKA